MPYKIDWNKDNTVITFTGELSISELREVGDAHYSARNLDDLDYLIADFTDANLSQLTLDVAETIASIDSVVAGYKEKFNMAFIASYDYQKSFIKDYIDYSKQFNSSWQYGIFSNLNEANNWIKEVIH